MANLISNPPMEFGFLRVHSWVPSVFLPRIALCRIIFLFSLGTPLIAQIPDAEVRQPPGASRLAAVSAAAQRDGWAPQIAGLRQAAVHAYGADQLAAAEAWFNVYRWAVLLAVKESHFIPRWIQAFTAAQVGQA